MLYQTYSSPIGLLWIVSEGDFLIGLWMEGQKKIHPEILDGVREQESAILKKTKAWLDRYFRGEPVSSKELCILLKGTEFQKEVWKLLMEIPYGEVTTYGALAYLLEQKFHHRISPQAVGGAVGRNPISIIVPCHRVVGARGSLTGYAGGIDKKEKLLKIEGIC